ncbi:MAG TPA: M20/M25/M40 family metallo-hydrolase [Allosphingosinicella sp.]|nr:M20/M25/M40 family metallo-hydrolase [Allosphingosinicella sp.]
MKQAGYVLALALALLAAMAVKGALLVLPSPPAAESATGFDANRAVARLERVLGDQRPHPVDSPAGDAVRDRLIAEMRSVGLEPRLTDDVVCNGRRGAAVSCARVRNLVATLGPAEGRHLLLVSHYDSTNAGPGAADDGIGVAAMLEIAHLLRGQRLARPVTFLFNEGEEAGLLGARAFLDRDPLAARVDIAINLEARGVNGPAIMFETSRPNAAAIDLFVNAARPVGNSFSTDLYRLIPNSTDVAVFEDRPWTILNFAVIGNETRYHSAGDDLAALDRRSVQHMGEQVLGVALAAAQTGPADVRGEVLYMDVAGQVVIALPLLFGLILLGLLFLFFGAQSWRRRAFARPLAAMFAAFILSGALAFAGHYLLSLFRAGDYWRAWPLVATTAVYASALAACAIGLLLVAGKAERTKLRAAFWLFFTLLGGGLCFVAPGSAIYFLLPPLAMAIGIVAGRWHPAAETAGALLAALLLYVTFGPAVALFEELMNGGPIWMFAPLGALIMLPVMIELLPAITRLRTIFAVAGALDLAILGWLVTGFTPAYSADRQQLFTIEYVWDEAARAGHFAVNNDGALIPYEADWQRTEFPHTARRRWAIPAPAVPTPAPGVTLVAQQSVPGGRRVRLRFATNGADSIALVAQRGVRLRAGGTPAALLPYGDSADQHFLRCAGRACDGAELDLIIAGNTPANFHIVGTRPGLPPAAAPLVRARPATARPQYGADATIAFGRVRL